MATTTDGQVNSAADEQPAAKPAVFSATEPATAELKPGNPRPRVSLGELKLDFSSRLLFYLMAGVLHLLSLLPDFILYPLGIVSGYVGYLSGRRRRKIGMCNLAIAFPERDERERRRILLASYVNFGRSAAEYVRLGGFFSRRLKKRVVYNDRFDYWKEVQQRHSGMGRPRGRVIMKNR
jgi:hypothetical protein